jgi:hypothetical protein
MTTRGKPRAEKKSRSKDVRSKPLKSKSKSSGKRAGSALTLKSAKHGASGVTIGLGDSGKYKVYGGKGGRVRPVGSKATASRIAGRLGVKASVFKEVDKLIESLRLRKQIG